jgi:uncharacterized protein Yka (UPF0111/DUF47 family)
MVFPVESEDRTMRNLLMLCQDHARLIVEAYRKILNLTDVLIKNQTRAYENIDEIKGIMVDTTKIKETLFKELHEIGGVLVTREDFYRLNSVFGDLIDTIKAIGIRIDAIKNMEYEVPEQVKKEFVGIVDLAFDSLLKLREGVMSMGFNSERARAFAHEIDELEKTIDDLLINVVLSIITSEAEMPVILILKDTANLIEEMVNMVKDASDLIRIISL